MLDTFPSRHDRNRGFTIIEMVVATTILAVLLVTVLSIATEVLTYGSYSEADFISQNQARRAFQRTSEILRKSGWSTVDATDYPTINDAEDELRFRILIDTDGNGYAFDAATGDLEWSERVFTIRRNPDTRMLQVFDADTPVWTLGSSIESVRFESFVEDGNLNLRELRVAIMSTRDTSDGTTIATTAKGSIFMRN